MKSTGCSTCCDAGPRTRRMRVLGTELTVKDYYCARNGGAYRPVERKPMLQLSILPTSWCTCACPFCIATDTGRRDGIDLGKLEKALSALRAEDVVRGISITGGEPFTDVKRLDRLIRLVFDIFGYGMEVSLNTNGCGLHRLGEIRDLSHVDAVHVSRHHWDDGLNRVLFGGGEVPDAEALRRAVASVNYPDIFVLNCMLLRGYVGTAEEVRRYLDFAIDIGARKVSFITGMPVNAFVRDRRVDYGEVLRGDDPAMLLTQRFQDYGLCRCQDGIYCSGNGRLIHFYGRRVDPVECGYARGLTYTPDNQVRAGYGGEVLWEG